MSGEICSESTQPCTSTDEAAEKCDVSTESTIKDVAMMSCKLDECEIEEEDRGNEIADGRLYPDFKRHKVGQLFIHLSVYL